MAAGGIVQIQVEIGGQVFVEAIKVHGDLLAGDDIELKPIVVALGRNVGRVLNVGIDGCGLLKAVVGFIVVLKGEAWRVSNARGCVHGDCRRKGSGESYEPQQHECGQYQSEFGGFHLFTPTLRVLWAGAAPWHHSTRPRGHSERISRQDKCKQSITSLPVYRVLGDRSTDTRTRPSPLLEIVRPLL